MSRRRTFAPWIVLPLLTTVGFTACKGDDDDPNRRQRPGGETPVEGDGDGDGDTGDGDGLGGGGGEGGAPQTGCAEATGPGTIHDTFLVEADETWTAKDSPHYVPSDIAIRGATVTLEKCATILISEGVTIEVGDSSGEPAELIARGVITEDQEEPVTISAESEDVYFASLWIDPTGFVDLEGTVIYRGGSVETANDNGTIVVAPGDELPVQERLRMVNSAILSSAGYGVNLGRNTAFTPDSMNLLIEGAGSEAPTSAAYDTQYPILTTAAGLSTLPTGLYVDNANDAILVDGATRFPGDVTMRHLGVPYDFIGGFHIEPDDDTVLTLSIAAGTTLRFPKGYDSSSDARFAVTLGSQDDADDPVNPRQVRLVAEGTADAPIVFTSRETSPAPGDWIGIDWGGGPSEGNVMSHVLVEYAGADSGANGFGCSGPETNAALFITDWRPSSAFITDSTFSDSAGGGIICGWDSATSGPDLTGNNTFTNISATYCDVAQPKVDGICPEGPLPICY